LTVSYNDNKKCSPLLNVSNACLVDPGATVFNKLESIRIGGNLNLKDEIVDYFYGIVAGKSMQSHSE